MIFDFQCRLCKLGRGITVPGEGSLTPKLIVVSDYPGIHEQKPRRPFMGSSGVLLRNALTNVVGLNLETDVFFTNVIKCLPPKKENDPDETEKVGGRELAVCRKWLDKELGMVTSKIILVAGEHARSVLLPNVKGALGKVHGSIYNDPLHRWKFFLTWNPAFVDQFSFRDLEGHRQMTTLSIPWLFWQDMQKLRALLIKEGVLHG